MKFYNIKIIDLIFTIIQVVIIIFGLFFIISGYLGKSEANRRQFEEATNLSQQSYFQDIQLLGIFEIILGVLILILSLTLSSIYLNFLRKL
ncbi:MAG: hypothetical protein GWO78_04170 [Dehalococcoidales bacterium]|nr:hypothetical protein [Dehalococcoidia bacterium]NCG35174.1 hypothetical protein [Dehalococcoidales bacterium]